MQGPKVGCLKTKAHLAYRGGIRGSVSQNFLFSERERATRSSFRCGNQRWTHLHQRFHLETRLSMHSKPRSTKPRGLASNRYPPLRHTTINKNLHAAVQPTSPTPQSLYIRTPCRAARQRIGTMRRTASHLPESQAKQPGLPLHMRRKMGDNYSQSFCFRQIGS